jgi:hypothetical protein
MEEMNAISLLVTSGSKNRRAGIQVHAWHCATYKPMKMVASFSD